MAESLKTLQKSPQAFRKSLLIDVQGGAQSLGSVLDPWQAKDFAALDASWQAVISPDESTAPKRAWLERPRGHSKTSDLAVMVTWCLFASKRRLNGVAAAADRDQAALLRRAIAGILALNPWLGKFLRVQQYRVLNDHTGSELRIISSDVSSSYGMTPDFVICDEVTHWSQDGLWVSLLSSSAKRQNCLLLVITNAGFGESWQADVRAAVKDNPRWYFHQLSGPQASWISSEMLAEQRHLLPEVAFRRLWLNEWSTGVGDAFSESDIQAALTLDGPTLNQERGWAYAAGLDLGLRRDASALVVVGKDVGWIERVTPDPPIRDIKTAAMIELGYMTPKVPETAVTQHVGSNRIKLCSVDVWRPEVRQVVLEEVENRIIDRMHAMRLVGVAYDQWQAEYLAERLKKQGIRMIPVAFQTKNLQDMAVATLDAFRDFQIDLYPDQTLISDLQSMRVIERSWGFRLEPGKMVKGGKGTRHGDAATALNLALFMAKGLTTERVLAGSRSFVMSPQPGALRREDEMDQWYNR